MKFTIFGNHEFGGILCTKLVLFYRREKKENVYLEKTHISSVLRLYLPKFK